MILNIKDLVFKERLAKKLVNQYMGLYIINKLIFINVVKILLPTSMRIHLVINVG